MKRFGSVLAFLCLFILSSLPSFAGNTATVAGSVKDIFNATDSSQQICFTLRDTRADNSGAYQSPVNPRVSGVGVISNYTGNCVSATAGSYSITPYANDVITTQNGQATVWAVTLKSKHGGETTLGTYRFTANNTYDLSVATPLSTVPAVTAPTGDTTYLRLDGGNIASLITTLAIPHNVTVGGTLGVTGATTLNGGTLNGTYSGNPTLSGNVAVGGTLGVTGTSTLSRILKECWVDGVTYTTMEAVQADSANCKSLHIPSGFTESFSGGIFTITRSAFPIVLEGCGISLTGQITAAGTVNSISIVAPFSSLSNGSVACNDLTYAGTGAAISIGDSATHSKDLYIRGINVNISGNGASCLKIANLDEFEVSNFKCSISAGTSPIGVITVGTGTFVGVGKFDNVQIVSGGGTNAIGYQFQNLSTHIQIVGGNLNLDTGASAVCFNLQGAGTQSIELKTPNANTCNTAVKVDNGTTSAGAVTGDFRIDSGVTTCVNYGTGTNANRLEVNDARCLGTAVVDNGTALTNSVFNAFDLQFNSRRWRIVSEAGATGFEIVDQSDGSQAVAKGVGGASHYDSSAGNPVRFNQNTGSGFEFWDNSAVTFGGTSAGLLTTYKKITTVSNGIPAEYATVDLTAQTAAIGTTTLYAVPATGAGQYRVSWDSKITTAAGVSSTLGALTIIYTDPDGVTIASVVPAIISGGGIATTATTNNTSTFMMGVPLTINAKASTNIQYSFAYASNAANAMAYNLHIKLEAM